MLSGSAFLRVIVLLAAAAILAGLAQHYLARPGNAPEPPRAEITRPPPAARPALREAPTSPQPSPAPNPAPASAAPPPAAPPEADQAAPSPKAAAPEAPPTEPVPDQGPAQPADGGPPVPGEVAAEPTDPPGESAGELVDLNTGSLAQLNGLKGGGSIGRAIIQRRPYASIDQLLSKRVLSRSTFQKIKDQVTVR